MDTPRSDTLRALIARSGLPLKTIAEQAGIPYQPLQRWVKGQTSKFDFENASRVHQFLVGREEA